MPQNIVVGDTNRCRCDPPPAANIPGTPGDPGTPGAAGGNGSNAWASLTADFTMPAFLGNGVASLDHTDWLSPGEPLWVEGVGTLLVVSIAGLNVTLQNLADGAGAYPGNAAPGTIAATTLRVTPTGFDGGAGPSTPGAFLIAHNLSEGNAPTMRANLGLGTAATASLGAFFQVANNLSEGVAATKRTNLGLGSAAVKTAGVADTNLPPVNQGGGLVAGQAVFATASGLESKTAANALLALGLTGGVVGSYALLQNQQAAGVDSGDFVTGGWVTVPINTEVSDAGGIVSLAVNVATLGTGIYRVRCVVQGYQVGKFQARLFNVSGAAVEFYGTNALADVATANMDESFIQGRLIVSGGPKNYRLEASCATTKGTDGFGIGNAFGGTQVYASWEIEKEL